MIFEWDLFSFKISIVFECCSIDMDNGKMYGPIECHQSGMTHYEPIIYSFSYTFFTNWMDANFLSSSISLQTTSTFLCTILFLRFVRFFSLLCWCFFFCRFVLDFIAQALSFFSRYFYKCMMRMDNYERDQHISARIFGI